MNILRKLREILLS